MKKWIALLTAMMMALSMTACGGSAEEKPAEKPEAEVKEEIKEEQPAEKPEVDPKEEQPAEKSAEEGQPAGETPEEYAAAKEAFKAKTKEDFTAEYMNGAPLTKEKILEYKALQRYDDFDPNTYDLRAVNSKYIRVSYDISKAAEEAGLKLEQIDFVKAFIDSPYPQLRVLALDSASYMLEDENKDYFRPIFDKMMAEETDVHVLAAMARPCMNQCDDPAIAEFVLKLAKHEDPVVRAASAVAATKQVPEIKDTFIAMLDDEDQRARGAAAKAVTFFDDPTLIPKLGEMLMNDADIPIHGNVAEALAKFCYDHPFYENTNSEAYKLLMDYLKKTPRTQGVPEWNAIGIFRNINKPENMDEWKTRATYYDADELTNALIEIIKDKEAVELSRRTAIQAAAVHANDEQFATIQPLVAGELTLEDAYNTELKNRQK